MRKNEIDIITLGCSKNLVDAERLMRQLELAGYRCVHDSADPKGEIAIINTCGFIGDAKEESIDVILQFAAKKTKGKLHKLYVMGCLSQRYREELPAEIPEVDKWFGKFDYMGIVEEVKGERLKGKGERLKVEGERLKVESERLKGKGERLKVKGERLKGKGERLKVKGERLKGKGEGYERTLTTPKHYAYLKIAEGCNRYCSYCAIPLITGRFTSRSMEEILDEVRWLVSEGVKEFNVIAQDLSSYGLDLYGEHRLAQLVDEMAQIEGVEWIRLHYTYPTDFPYDLLPVMAKHKNVCKYMDIALQHCSDHMLKKMHRHITREEQDAVIARIRQEVPGICIRTTLLVGHPGETEEDFNELCEWVKAMKFERMGAFAYSEEEGTYAATHYTDDIPQEEKERRVDQLMAIQQDISAELLRTMVGKKVRVLIDREEDKYYIGRTEYDSPEVDCEVLIEKGTRSKEQGAKILKTGEFYTVTIQKTEDFDLYASL